MRRLYLFIFISIMSAGLAHASTVSDDVKKAWGYSNFDVSNGSTDEFVILGGTGNEKEGRGPIDCSYIRANQSQAHGLIGVIARRIVKHGGYFCPTQVVCDSRADKKAEKVHFAWYNPATADSADFAGDQTEISSTSCAWLCDEGYYGDECKQTTTTSCEPNTRFCKPGTSCGKGDDIKSSVFVGVRMRRNHDRAATEGIAKSNCKSISKIDSEIPYFEEKSEPAKGVVLGVIKFLNHGVVAAPIKLTCAKRKDRKTNLDGISLADGDSRILCARGYRPANDDCVAINQSICNKPDIKYCENFPSDRYHPSEHTLDTNSDECIKYFCTNDKFAFKSASDTTCIECVKDIRTGINRTTGLCKTCKTGEYFNTTTYDCSTADQYNQQNLKYGKSSTKKSNLDAQCWTLDGKDYKDCVNK